jgi:Ser/Thr protein kinase RdoA (MazF antagonist)
MHLNPTLAQSQALGQATAQIHRHADASAPKYARPKMDITYFVERPLRNIQRIFGHLPTEMELLTDAANTVTNVLQILPRIDLDYGLCHGDLHTGNVHFVADTPALFDFDCLGYGWRAYDLATFWWSHQLFEPDEEQQQACWQAFVASYAAERPLHPTTLSLIPVFTLARQLWVMGIHTDAVTVHYGRSWLNEKYVQKHFSFLRKLWQAVKT